jgi:cystathionine gamma-synthase
MLSRTPVVGRPERRVPVTRRISTQAVHSGEERRKPSAALTTPIVQTSTYTFQDTAEILDFMHSKAAGGEMPRVEYGRYGNPTQSAVEHKMAALEGGERALLFASGMGAIATTLAALLRSGDHLILARDVYHRTRDFASDFLPRWGVETTFVPVEDLAAMDAAIRPSTRAIFSETPTNPYLSIMDLQAMAEIGAAHGITTIVDSTFATPVNLRPLEYGVDLVVHSATKYLGGHNDLLAGVVVGASGLVDQISEARGVLGAVSSPHDAYLLLRGLKTLEVRVSRQNESGLRLAEFLQQHAAVRRVYYPGLPSHPQYDLARRQMSGFGGVVSFEVDGDLERTSRLVDLLRIPYIGPTLGGVESIVQQPALLYSLDPAERRQAGLEDNLVRYAVGIEDPKDLIADLRQALDQL